METILKSPNKLWRESGTSLSFADWIQREKDKNNFLINKKFENFANVDGETDDAIWLQDSMNESRKVLGIDVHKDEKKKDNTFVGLNKGILLLSALIIVGAIGYKFYKKNK